MCVIDIQLLHRLAIKRVEKKGKKMIDLKERLYNVVHVKTGFCNTYPMPHKECCNFMSKMMVPSDWMLVEVRA